MFRLATEEDYLILVDIYRQSVRKIAPLLYSQEQVAAWSASPDNESKFKDFIFVPKTYLIQEQNQIIAFCGLENNGHIASLYVNPLFYRQGYGQKILLYVLQKGIEQNIKRFYTEASFFSQPLFKKCGFSIIAMETVKYGEVSFERYKMEKYL